MLLKMIKLSADDSQIKSSRVRGFIGDIHDVHVLNVKLHDNITGTARSGDVYCLLGLTLQTQAVKSRSEIKRKSYRVARRRRRWF